MPAVAWFRGLGLALLLAGLALVAALLYSGRFAGGLTQVIELRQAPAIDLGSRPGAGSIPATEQSRRPGAGERASRLFCYSLVMNEPTLHLLSKQLRSSCDGSALFGMRDDPSVNLIRVFDKEEDTRGWRNQMREQVIQGVWGYLRRQGLISRYQWFLKLEADSFVRPSTLWKTLSQLPGTLHIFSIGYPDLPPEQKAGPDGFFVAMRQSLALDLLSQANHTRDCDQLLSGHSEGKGDYDNFKLVQSCEKRTGLPNLVSDLVDTKGRQLVLQNPICGLGAGPHCNLAPSCTGLNLPNDVSPNFVSVHQVKNVECYQWLANHFP